VSVAAERRNPKEENRGGTLQSSNKTYHRYDVPERVDSNTAERRNPKEENRGGRCRSGISQHESYCRQTRSVHRNK